MIELAKSTLREFQIFYSTNHPVELSRISSMDNLSLAEDIQGTTRLWRFNGCFMKAQLFILPSALILSKGQPEQIPGLLLWCAGQFGLMTTEFGLAKKIGNMLRETQKRGLTLVSSYIKDEDTERILYSTRHLENTEVILGRR